MDASRNCAHRQAAVARVEDRDPPKGDFRLRTR